MAGHTTSQGGTDTGLAVTADAYFASLLKTAATICQTPISLVSFLTNDRQYIRAAVGIDCGSTERRHAICSYTVQQEGLFVVPDTLADDRFRENPYVTGEPHIRFYAGIRLATPDRSSTGVVCVIDRVPRTLTDQQCANLKQLSLLLSSRYQRLAPAGRDQ